MLTTSAANLDALDRCDELVVDALEAYGKAVGQMRSGDRTPGSVASQRFEEHLRDADRVVHVLNALTNRLVSRADWEPHAIVEHIREVVGEDEQHSAAQPFGTMATTVELPQLSPARLQETVRATEARSSIPFVWDILQPGPLADVLARTPTKADNAAHRLHLAARRLGRHQDIPLRCYEVAEHTLHKGYQRRAVERVVSDMHGRAVLADHVGLGKTIEAGLVLTEYRLRGLVRRCLIIVPSAGLRDQWLYELRDKFMRDDAVASAHDRKTFSGWSQHDTIVTTYGGALRHADAIKASEWDMLIVDEAHHLHNRGTRLFKFVSKFRSRYLLLLTATPFQRRIEDLYSLARLVRPTLFVKLKRFRALYGHTSDEVQLRELKTLLSQIMIRSTIAGVGGEVTTGRRLFRNPSIELTVAERDFYQEVIAVVIAASRSYQRLPPLYFLLARQATSSAEAALSTLEGVLGHSSDSERESLNRLRHLASRISVSSKTECLRQIIAATHPRKVLVFVEFRRSALALGRDLPACVIHGGLSASERLAQLEAVQRGAGSRVLVVTPGMVEGMNFQFCSVLVNFDLPWNPARIEQRIGRIQRIGQRHDHLEIYSLASTRTIEEEIRNGLVEKVRVFERLLGPLDLVLGPSDNWSGLQARLAELIKDARTEQELRAAIATLFDNEITPVVARIQTAQLQDISVLLRGVPLRRRS